VQVPINATITKGFCSITSGSQFLSIFDLNSDNLGRDAGVLAGKTSSMTKQKKPIT